MVTTNRRKAAVARLLTALRDANVNALWGECATLSSRWLIYALGDPSRANTPNDRQIEEIRAYARRHIAQVAACVECFDELVSDTDCTRADDTAAQDSEQVTTSP